MAEYLTVNSKMEEPLIGEYIKRYDKEKWLQTDGPIKREEYYQFNTVLQKQIKLQENEEAGALIENLFSSEAKEKNCLLVL